MTGALTETRLSASSLWSRHGFADGQPFEFSDPGRDHDDDPPHPDWTLLRETLDADGRRRLLADLIEMHLVPAIERTTGEAPRTRIIGTGHNPIRDARMGAESMPDAWNAIHVDLAREVVIAAALRIAHGQGEEP